MLAHAKHQQIGSGIQQNRRAHRIIPIIVVGEPTQRRFQPANRDGNIAVHLTDLATVHNGGAIWSATGFAARGVGIVVSPLFGGGIVRYHRIDVAAVDKKGEPRPTKPLKILQRARLGQNAHTKARVLQHTRHDRGAKAGMVDIGVAGHQDNIRFIPAAGSHFFSGDGQKRHTRSSCMMLVCDFIGQ